MVDGFGTTIIGIGTCTGDLIVGSDITAIGAGAFRWDSQNPDKVITSIDLRASQVTSIGEGAFRDNLQLQSVLFSSMLTDIGSYAFYGDQGLHSINFPSTLATIGFASFGYAQIGNIEIPNSVTDIGEGAFVGNIALTTLNIGSGLINLGFAAFPSSFMGNVTVSSDNTHFRSIEHYLYSVDPNDRILKLTGIVVENTSTPGDQSQGDGMQGDGMQGGGMQGGGMQGNSQQGVAMQGDGRTFAGDLGPSATISSDMEHPEIQIATIPSGVFVARIPATSNLPATTLNFSENAPAQVTVAPVALPASELALPFTISRSMKIVDIQISGTFSGTATVCLDGASTDHLFHFTGTPAAWIELPSRAYVNGQVCGITDSFSPFTAAPPIAAAITAAPDPVQQSKIASLSILTAVAQTSAPVVILGTFIEKVAAIHISGTPLSTNSWTQTPTSISFTMPAQIKGVYQIQIYNGSAPVLDVQTFTFIGSEIQVSPKPGPIVKPKVTYIRCVKPGRGTRIAYGINPSCPVGYVKK